MALKGKGITLEMVVHNCQNWETLPDLIEVLEKVLDEFSLKLLQREPYYEEKDPTQLLIPRGDFATFCQRKYQQSQARRSDAEYIQYGLPTARLYLYFWAPFAEESATKGPSRDNLIITVVASEYADGYRGLSISSSPTIRRETEWIGRKRYRERAMQLIGSMGQSVIGSLMPSYVWGAERGADEQHIKMEGVLAHRLETIYWANYFGPGYLKPEVENLFLNAPVGIVRRLAGGIWYQLHENFETVDDEAVERIEHEVLSYFADLNLDRVQWRFTAK